MFTIGGYFRMPNYQTTKYEPVELILETQKEVRLLFIIKHIIFCLLSVNEEFIVLSESCLKFC